MWSSIIQHIATTTGAPLHLKRQRPIGGGCINSAYVLEGTDRCYFVKLNRADRVEMFAAEAAGLEEIHASLSVRAPMPICWGTTGNQAYLVLEYLELGSGIPRGAEKLGRQLALMHRHTAPYYGWHRDNTIGSTPQRNTPTAQWADFWREQRLGYQLALAAQHGYGGVLQRLGERLMSELETMFTAYMPLPALLHGDLWSGNADVTSQGEPVIFDPAVYYGDRETDIAMTELFSGFPTRFYDAYEDIYPLDTGYTTRKTLYNLYHVLNHLNLFGGGYLAQAKRMMEELINEIK